MAQNIIEENWLEIPGTNIVGIELYRISNFGRIKSVARPASRGSGCYERQEKILTPLLDKDGYTYVSICSFGSKTKIKIHRAVALAFVPNPDNKAEVNHLNGIKSDNLPGNLEWSTRAGNLKHAKDTGLKSHEGEKNPICKLTEPNVIEIKTKLANGEGLAKIALEYHVCLGTIRGIKYGTSWKHVK